eukprot:Rhum_TRINITY_DN14796_c7_g1::Rhum_TRINITY_DN14796_c7_g1_i1::g.118939::m.118939/K00685/ATE1; arginyl-tRNA---protein transferase
MEGRQPDSGHGCGICVAPAAPAAFGVGPPPPPPPLPPPFPSDCCCAGETEDAGSAAAAGCCRRCLLSRPQTAMAARFLQGRVLEAHRSDCSYCRTPGGFHTKGVVVDRLSVEEFSCLLNAGWRRFGKYLWCQADDICCRQYPLRVDVRAHQPNRDHRKVWKRLEKHLRKGGCDADAGPAHEPQAPPLRKKAQQTARAPAAAAAAAAAAATVSTGVAASACRLCHSCSKPMSRLVRELPEGYSEPSCDVCHGGGLGEDAAGYWHCAGCLLDTHVWCSFSSLAGHIVDSIPEGFLWRYVGSRAMEVRVAVPSVTREKFDLFMKYQQEVHQEEANGVLGVLRIGGGDGGGRPLTDEEMFSRFLVDSPLHNDGGGGTSFHGTFHFEYRLDDRLFMVTVTDLLPNCVNSVYCFYDPALKPVLQPGKLSILYEMEWMRKQRAYQEFAYYFLGMYLDSPKMAYKAKYHPSELLSAERNLWVPFETVAGSPSV